MSKAEEKIKESGKLSLGIDVGSTTVKVVLMQGDEIIYKKYSRHMSEVRKKTLELISEAAPLMGGEPVNVSMSGSAGLGIAESTGIPFVQEVFAAGEVVKRLEPDTTAVIELGGEDA
ncbi:MAG: 2-hydroxyglutaryl-CoA dehydratase, partial [Firmicutes bacterium]|nr:2-hydroxyglutaryl-CoA dehydratase [Bacillota bacterium]